MSVATPIIELPKRMENKMLENNWDWSDLLAALKTKDGVAGLNPNAYAFGLCFSQLTDKQKKQIAQLVNSMEKKVD